jgi:hypothetical protein
MTDGKSEAHAVALNKFGEDEPAAKLDNYTVTVNELADTFEIEFLPKRPPMDFSDPSNVMVTFGERTANGRYIRYVVEKATNNIIGRSFGR